MVFQRLSRLRRFISGVPNGSIMFTLLLATRNRHKIGEIQAILGDNFRYQSLDDFPGAPEVIEDATTFAGNATKKAVVLARWLAARDVPEGRRVRERFVLADDSGLEVDALHGAPGVHSARFAALDSAKSGNSSDAENRSKLLRLLEEIPVEKRTARFRCVLAVTPLFDLTRQNSSPVCAADQFEIATQLFEGQCEGRIIFGPRGSGGFGYDPLFIPDGFSETFAELSDDLKNSVSHRARALHKLRQNLLRVISFCQSIGHAHPIKPPGRPAAGVSHFQPVAVPIGADQNLPGGWEIGCVFDHIQFVGNAIPRDFPRAIGL